MAYVLGINCVYHELSAVLLKNGDVVAVMEEERLSRIKHGKSATISNAGTIPLLSIKYCLEQAQIEFSNISFVGTSLNPDLRLKNVGIDTGLETGGWGTLEGETNFIQKVKSIPMTLESEFGVSLGDRFVWINHHEAHAASTFLASPYSEAAIVSIDGIGEVASTWIGHGKQNDMNCLLQINYPNSLGFLWEKICKFLGFSEYNACKVMGLASYGNSNVYRSEFEEIIQIQSNGGFTVNNTIMNFRSDSFKELENLFKTPKIDSPKQLRTVHEDIASSLQAVTNEVILNICQYAKNTTKSNNLCLAGGVALNCVSNTAILECGLFKSLFIQPAAHDGGTALGCALYIWNKYLKYPRTYVMRNSFTTMSATDAEIEDALKYERLEFEKFDNIEAVTAQLLAEGTNIIGWFQGSMEWGPRALGNRSLLTDPRNAEMKEILNIRIKKREPFRPFAPSVLEEKANEWFEIPDKTSTQSKEYMLFTFRVRHDKIGKIPAVTHVDNTSRIQVVRAETNPRYHKLISEFEKLTNVPMVLNTSFNDNEPIVCTPKDAICTFKRTRMDYLVLHNYLVRQNN